MAALALSLLLCIVLIAVSLWVKGQIERFLFRWRNIPLLHAANIVAIAAIVAAIYYRLGGIDVYLRNLTEISGFWYVFIGAMQLILPLYLFACWLLARQREREKKYTRSKDKKVLYINEKYLARRHRDHYRSKTS
ncbi:MULTISPECIES: hypothetical protein [Geobacillus]|jgi:hypothetical protein|uniref:Uncharacterized protein n=2 Tax=Geobacillus thermodenitrificans TaxID=33940 RepID=A4IN92_GEOTN|nr:MULTISPECIES: hypothetical protein [Geobacillus]ABO66796.1 Conserved hypothetical protein [Geobacillus thermodenitrificans NG80-2]ARA96851.1 hypothetical protein GD3902_01615 [Geobacillus thermodenitrificans]ARP42562.1 hypothetical protein GTHT12_01006 [Geobacillus thermodenitrificans]ATO36122.1 hypothetical protein GTID1_02175 [Geobacillus thermodenitrificans]KQB93502.1 hypothetical protein GEPA3_1501 [Geobacillus sp. PA-3]